jgi:hypothetical protein
VTTGEAASPFSADRLATFRAHYAPTSFDKAGLLGDEYLLATEGPYRVYYVPLGALPSPDAKVVLVGLTPGFTQVAAAARAFAEAPPGIREDPSAYSETLRHRVSFEGSMRRNLCSMLDAVGLPTVLGIRESMELFGEAASLAAVTSALVYPVFVGSELRNFRGAGSELARIGLFRLMLDELLAPRLACAPDALIVPLGVAAATGVAYLRDQGIITVDRILVGMPHPSGANGHRHEQFRENADALRSRIAGWFSQPPRKR